MLNFLFLSSCSIGPHGCIGQDCCKGRTDGALQGLGFLLHPSRTAYDSCEPQRSKEPKAYSIHLLILLFSPAFPPDLHVLRAAQNRFYKVKNVDFYVIFFPTTPRHLSAKVLKGSESLRSSMSNIPGASGRSDAAISRRMSRSWRSVAKLSRRSLCRAKLTRISGGSLSSSSTSSLEGIKGWKESSEVLGEMLSRAGCSGSAAGKVSVRDGCGAFNSLCLSSLWVLKQATEQLWRGKNARQTLML